MKRLRIEHYKALEKADFYTIRFIDKDICETDEFISRFINDLLHQDDVTKIVYWLNKMGQEFGTVERFFRLERGAVKAIPIYKSKLRLYCIRLSDELLILGNGGVKTSQKLQDSPDAFPSFDTMVKLERSFRHRKGRNVISVSGRRITGNLHFDID